MLWGFMTDSSWAIHSHSADASVAASGLIRIAPPPPARGTSLVRHGRTGM